MSVANYNSWTYWDGRHTGSCSSMSAQKWANTVLNIIGDAIVLMFPLPFVWNLNLSLTKKLGVTAMFGVGFLWVVDAFCENVLIVLQCHNHQWYSNQEYGYFCNGNKSHQYVFCIEGQFTDMLQRIL